MPLPRPRLALASLLLSFLAVIIALNPGADGRARAEEYDGIAGVALKYVGQHGGQCWTFVQKVVREATGKRMGFDYRQGYFDAGAVEVSLEEARAGDVIQIIGDYTGPDAEDRGMHTAIVLENHGNGKFEVVDSNHNWDEMVTRHDDYNPAEAAKESGLNVHVYRFDGGTATPPVLPPAPREPSDPATLRPGDTVVVVTGQDCLNLRTSPTITADNVNRGNEDVCLNDGTELTILAGPIPGGGLSWVEVSTPAGRGWVAASYLALVKPGAPASGGDGGTGPIGLPFKAILPGIAAGE